MPKKSATSTRIKYPNKIVDAKYWLAGVGQVDNGGWHPLGKRNYAEAVKKIQQCLRIYKKPKLFHLCFIGRTNDDHKSLLKALAEQLTRTGQPNEWFSAREVDAVKGEHLHIFVLIDASDVHPQTTLNTFEDRWLGKQAKRRGIDVRINPPRNKDIHKEAHFVSLPWLESPVVTSELAISRLDDALVWLTYIYKARSKPESAALGQIFSASRPMRQSFKKTAVMPIERKASFPSTREATEAYRSH